MLQRGSNPEQVNAPCCASCAAGRPCESLPPDPISPTLRCKGSVCLHLPSLREALGRTELVEAMEGQMRASGRPSVNAAKVWNFFTTSVYASGDLPYLATREALQNAVDAIRAAIRARQISQTEGRFEVTWDPVARILTFEDNGIGMDAETILGKFLSLGDSGKHSAVDSTEASGGFGVAKAVILGVSASFDWEMHTRDNRAVSTPTGEVEIFEAPLRQGTRIVLRDIPSRYAAWHDYNRDRAVDLVERLRELLGANELPGITLLLNGDNVPPLFSRRGGSKVSVGPWGADIQATVKLYRRTDRAGGYYIRLGGLLQHKKSAQRTTLPADCVVDLTTTLRPGQPGYPLTASRDSLQYPARDAFYDLVAEVEQEAESAGHNQDDEVFLPDTEGGHELAEMAHRALESPEVQAKLHKATSGLSDYLRAQAEMARAASPVDSHATASTRVADFEQAESQLAVELATTDTPFASADALSHYLESQGLLNGELERVLVRARQGALAPHETQALDDALQKATQAAMGPNGGGLLQALGVSAAYKALQALDPQAPRRSPFGSFAGLRISKTHYDRAKARRFWKTYERWIPHLVCWDQTLRLIAREGHIRRRFRPGFVLNDTVNALAASESSQAVIYVNPGYFAALLKAHRDRPLAIAASLHHLACHELAHLDGRMGEGHSESFAVAREDLGIRTAHLLEPIAALLTEVLGLPTPSKDSKAPKNSKAPKSSKPKRRTWQHLALQRTTNAVVRHLLLFEPERMTHLLRGSHG